MIRTTDVDCSVRLIILVGLRLTRKGVACEVAVPFRCMIGIRQHQWNEIVSYSPVDGTTVRSMSLRGSQLYKTGTKGE